MAVNDVPELERSDRLAELVETLTGADRCTSLHAVRENSEQPGDVSEDALELVARAMVRIDQPSPVRMGAYLDGLGVPGPDGAQAG